MNFDDCPCSGKNLAKLVKPAVMAALSRGEMHGYVLGAALEESGAFGGSGPDLSGIYRVLKELEARGLVQARWDHGASGPARRSYRLTVEGAACLEEWRKSLSAFSNQLAAVLRLVDEASRDASEKARDDFALEARHQTTNTAIPPIEQDK